MGYTLIDTYHFLSGATMFGAWVCGAFFFKFWLNTRDRLFLIFGISFWFMALERLVMIFQESPTAEDRATVYLIRLAAFLLILFGIIDKNRKEA